MENKDRKIRDLEIENDYLRSALRRIVNKAIDQKEHMSYSMFCLIKEGYDLLYPKGK